MTTQFFAASRSRVGLSLVETMISLTIVAMLLVSVAAAFSASASLIENNDEFFRVSSAARISVSQVMSESRRCQAMEVFSDHINMITAESQDRTYKLVGGNLLMVTNNDTTDPDYVLASDITSLMFAADGKSVSIILTVQVGPSKVTLSGSALQRRLVTYH